MTVRIATGTAVCLGLTKGSLSSRPTTAHLLTPGRCAYDCAYCTKAKSAKSDSDFMCRVKWPAFPEVHVWDALERESEAFERICVQVVNGTGTLDMVKMWIRTIRDRCRAPISVEVRLNELEDVEDLLMAGADYVGLPLDVASESLHPVLRGGRLDQALEFVLSSAGAFPGRISTHLIVGLGETDEELVNISRQVQNVDVPLGLFAFTPCKGTRLESMKPPSLRRYRRLQLALHLIDTDEGEALEFDRDGGLILPSLGDDDLARIMEKAFLTRGCEGCNRPFYNERPGCTPYNYPQRLTVAQIAEEMRVIRE
jgi:biotin synthase